MNESETIIELNEHFYSEIDETYSPPDPGFWQNSQILSDDNKILDFNAALNENPFPRFPNIDFQAEEEQRSNARQVSAKNDDAAQLHPSCESQAVLTRRNQTCDCSAQELLATITAIRGDSCPTPPRLGSQEVFTRRKKTCECCAQELHVATTASIGDIKDLFFHAFPELFR